MYGLEGPERCESQALELRSCGDVVVVWKTDWQTYSSTEHYQSKLGGLGALCGQNTRLIERSWRWISLVWWTVYYSEIFKVKINIISLFTIRSKRVWLLGNKKKGGFLKSILAILFIYNKNWLRTGVFWSHTIPLYEKQTKFKSKSLALLGMLIREKAIYDYFEQMFSMCHIDNKCLNYSFKNLTELLILIVLWGFCILFKA